ncbi:hypothetical protein A3C57_02170 [Candidatus Nomurabacteria bacterium RIFCSPHIGHO2_02_FULL_33_12]|nr:MAG: hypothetical protein A3C57_02170 [Candidatus Nomurabacteria bacterium RIFCSPHIGHO2_02_FULL_33_12]
MKRELEQFKNDIIIACDHIKDNINGQTLESFTKDVKTSHAVMMEFIIIGEAATHFSEEIRERNPDIRWSSVVGMRNIMAHDYFEIDPKVLWDTATIAVPKLKEQMEAISLEV